MTDRASDGRLPRFFYRFAHPSLAVVTAVGFVFWLAGFAIAGAGVALEATNPLSDFGALYFYGALVGLAGIVVVGAVVAYLVALWLLRDVLGVLDWEKPEPGAKL